MRCCAAGLVLFTSVLSVPSAVWASTICVPEDPEAPAAARAGVVAGKAAKGAAEYHSFSGAASYVYGSFSGCAARSRLSVGNALNLAYAKASGEDPFDRLTGRTHDDESFFDAELRSAIGDLGRIGYAASLHTIDGTDRSSADRVAGSRVWFNSPDDRLRVSSELAVSVTDAMGGTGSAQRHQLSMTVADLPGATLSTAVSFSDVDEDFRARRSTALPDRRTLGATASLRAGKASLSLSLSRARNNLDDDPDRATQVWRSIGARGAYRIERGRLLPDVARFYANRTERYETVGGASEPSDPVAVNETAGVALSWTDWLDGGAAQDGGATALSADVVAEWKGGSALETPHMVTRANARLSFDLDRSLAVPAEVTTRLGITSGESAEARVGGKWAVSAEVDLLDLLFDTPSNGGDYLLARVESTVRSSEAGLQLDYRGLLAAGLRF